MKLLLCLAWFCTPVLAQTVYLEPGPNIVSSNQQVDVSSSREQCRVQLRSKPTCKMAKVQHALSALGFRWYDGNHIINYVDHNSDAYGRIYPGDILVSANNMSPEVWRYQGYYLGNENTSVPVCISRAGVVYTFPIVRHPVSSFGPGWQGGRWVISTF
jgi:hypothetical protein